MAAKSRVPKPSAIEYVMAGAWFCIWMLTLLWASIAVPEANANQPFTGQVIDASRTLGIGAVALLIACGYLLAHGGRWFYLGALTLYVWALLLAGYIGAMLMVPPSAGGTDDAAAGAGLAILGIPALLVVGALVGLGAAGGAAVRALRQRRQRSVAALSG